MLVFFLNQLPYCLSAGKEEAGTHVSAQKDSCICVVRFVLNRTKFEYLGLFDSPTYSLSNTKLLKQRVYYFFQTETA